MLFLQFNEIPQKKIQLKMEVFPLTRNFLFFNISMFFNVYMIYFKVQEDFK